MIEKRRAYDPKAVAEREAELIGRPQRIEPLRTDDLKGEGEKKLVAGIRTALGLGPTAAIPEFCLLMAKHPEMFRCQMEMGTAIFKGVVPPRERELAVLRIAWLIQAPYEWGEHVDISKRYGVTPQEIERVKEGAAAAGWSEQDAAILAGVEELLSDQAMTDETWALLAKYWDEPQLIEYLMTVGQYVATALVQNALRVRLEDDNPGLTHR